jgi:nucleoside-diphosphate-sugar epimerase
VVHAAGLVRARSRAEFLHVNRDGTGRIAAAVASHAPRARFVLVSSQAARAPELSPYAESKRAGETAAAEALSGTPFVVVRPCVIYGPWDREGLALLRMAQQRWAPGVAAPEPRIAMIHARDAAASIAVLSRDGPEAATFEITDENAGGYAWSELLRAAGAALGRTPRVLPLPDAVFRGAGAASGAAAMLAGRAAIFNRGKVREILHRDWSSDPARQPPRTLWAPRIGLSAGLAETVAWWRSHPA